MTGPSEDGYTPPEDRIDLGNDHSMVYSAWAPDRELNPNTAHLPDVEKFGAVIYHENPAGEPCAGFVTFEGDVQREVSPATPAWTVESWEPLTITPSVLCSCGDHGFIRDGRWVPA